MAGLRFIHVNPDLGIMLLAAEGDLKSAGYRFEGKSGGRAQKDIVRDL
jgi:hypothetical protein